MKYFLFSFLAIIYGHSLVISAPVNQTVPDSQKLKQEKVNTIAAHLLKELADQQHPKQFSNDDESKENIAFPKHSETAKVESKRDDDFNDEYIDFVPAVNDLYEIYDDKYDQLPDDEELSSESIDDSYALPITRQQLIRYLAEQEANDEPMIHSPIMDDSIMTEYNH